MTNPSVIGRIDSFDFLVGTWIVRHRRLRTPLSSTTAATDWYEFFGLATAQTHFGGAVSIDEIGLANAQSRADTRLARALITLDRAPPP